MFLKNKIYFCLFLICSNIFALESITIPDAVCGNGAPYKVFIDRKSNDKLLVEFMGGGACWDFTSCFIIPHTWIYPIPEINSLSIFTNNQSEMNFLKGHSKVYFPYCTGDVHAGNHIGNYANGTKVFHHGYKNIINGLNYLREQKIIHFNKVNDLILYGASAGALATMIHGKTIELMMAKKAHKTMLIDSPGLHWGKTFWEKFPKETIHDFDLAFRHVNLNLDFKDGFIAKDMKVFFSTYKNWKIGFFFGTKDLIMSSVFGDISPYDQESLILSKRGLPNLASDFTNLKVWVRDTPMHTFLLLSESAKLESFDGISAIDFAKSVYDEKD